MSKRLVSDPGYDPAGAQVTAPVPNPTTYAPSNKELLAAATADLEAARAEIRSLKKELATANEAVGLWQDIVRDIRDRASTLPEEV